MSMETQTESVEKEDADSMSGYRKASSHSQNDRPKSVKVRLSEGAGVPGYRTPVVTTYTEEEILDRLGPARTYHIDVVHIHNPKKHGGGGKK